MKIDAALVDHLAALSRLALDAAEKARLAAELGAILEAVEKVNELDLEGVEPMVFPVPIENVFREDEPRGFCLERERALEGAPERTAEGFRVPRVLSEGA